MWNEVLETYRCVISAKKNLPGTRIEDLFASCTTADLEKEYKFLQEKAKQEGYEENESAL